MIHGCEKSDSVIVATKPTNTADTIVDAQHDDVKAVEPVEPRTEAKRNAGEQSTPRAQDRNRVSQALDRIRQAARQRKKERFTALLHHISVDCLRMAFFALKRDAAPGVDGLMWRTYEADLDRNLIDLHARVHSGAYRALPSRRRYIPKADGKQRPLGTSRLRWLRSSRRSTRRSFWGLATGSDRDAASTMRWMRSHTELMHVKSTGFSTPTYQGSSIL